MGLQSNAGQHVHTHIHTVILTYLTCLPSSIVGFGSKAREHRGKAYTFMIYTLLNGSGHG